MFADFVFHCIPLAENASCLSYDSKGLLTSLWEKIEEFIENQILSKIIQNF